jgi:hypothetical protein
MSAGFLLEELPYWSLRMKLRTPVFSRLPWASLVRGVGAGFRGVVYGRRAGTSGDWRRAVLVLLRRVLVLVLIWLLVLVVLLRGSLVRILVGIFFVFGFAFIKKAVEFVLERHLCFRGVEGRCEGGWKAAVT